MNADPVSAPGAGPFPSFSIKIDDDCVDHIKISPASPSVTVGGSVQLTAQALDEHDSPVTIPVNYLWTSSDSALATVDENSGNVNGIAAGTATIEVQETNSTKTASADINVSGATEFKPAFSQPPEVTALVTSVNTICNYGKYYAVGSPAAVAYPSSPDTYLYALSEQPGYSYDRVFTCLDCKAGKWAFTGTASVSGTLTGTSTSPAGSWNATVTVGGGQIVEAVHTQTQDRDVTSDDTMTSTYDIQSGVQTFEWVGTIEVNDPNQPGCGPNGTSGPHSSTAQYSFSATYNYPVTPTDVAP